MVRSRPVARTQRLDCADLRALSTHSSHQGCGGVVACTHAQPADGSIARRVLLAAVHRTLTACSCLAGFYTCTCRFQKLKAWADGKLTQFVLLLPPPHPVAPPSASRLPMWAVDSCVLCILLACSRHNAVPASG